MKLPTLYSRTSTGATQTWTIEIDGGRYRTEYGQIDGKKTTWNGPAIGHSLENAFHGAGFESVVDGVISSVIHYGTIIPKTPRK